jgi:hypothetical protein
MMFSVILSSLQSKCWNSTLIYTTVVSLNIPINFEYIYPAVQPMQLKKSRLVTQKVTESCSIAVGILLHIQEAPGSNLGLETCYPDRVF